MMSLTPFRSVFSFAIAAFLLGSTSSTADAGPLLDWILGRNTTVAPGYAVGYPVVPSTGAYAAGYAPYTAGYTPAAYAANYAPGGYAANYAPAATTAYSPVTAYSVPTPVPVGSTYNPYRDVTAFSPTTTGSVVTGVAPTTSDVASVAPVTAPVVTAYSPGTVAGSPYYGTGNLYPNGVAYTALSPTVSRPGPIRRLLARLFGHGYRTSYYAAPVTYYRPVPTVAPTGATTTSLSPCTSYQYQIQRTPSHSLLPTATYPATTCPDACGQTYASPQGAVPGFESTVPSQTPTNTVIPGAPSTDVPGYPAPANGGDTSPLQAPALAPGTYVPGAVSNGVGVQSSFGRPAESRRPNPNVKPIPAESPKANEPILPGDRTASADREASVVPAGWTRISEPTQTRAVARPAFEDRSPAPRATRPEPQQRKVYQDVDWN